MSSAHRRNLSLTILLCVQACSAQNLIRHDASFDLGRDSTTGDGGTSRDLGIADDSSVDAPDSQSANDAAPGCEIPLRRCGSWCAVCPMDGVSSTTCSGSQCAAESCMPGYTLLSQSCVDVNECTSDNGGCGGEPCTNLPGGFRCGDRVEWGRLPSSSLMEASVEHAMVFDSARQRVVLFGGGRSEDGVRYRGTWEWGAETGWIRVSQGGPSARYGHAMVYDTHRQRVLLFGGSESSQSFLNDTWEWDGASASWTSFTRPGPSARTQHTMAYDSDRRRAVLFGGLQQSFERTGDTWEWNSATATWAQISGGGAEAPVPRSGSAMTYDTHRHVALMFGGSNETTLLEDLWQWDGTTWTEIEAQAPGRRNQHTLVYDTARNRAVMFGGQGAAIIGDTWFWDSAQMIWSESVRSPAARRSHAAAFDDRRGRMVLFGGSSSVEDLDDTWELSL